MKIFCRGFCFIVTGLYTALLVKNPDANWIYFVILVIIIGITAGFGWDND